MLYSYSQKRSSQLPFSTRLLCRRLLRINSDVLLYVNTKFNSSPPEHAPLWFCLAGTGHNIHTLLSSQFPSFASFLLCFRLPLPIQRLRHNTSQWSPGISTTGVTTSRERLSSQLKRCGTSQWPKDGPQLWQCADTLCLYTAPSPKGGAAG